MLSVNYKEDKDKEKDREKDKFNQNDLQQNQLNDSSEDYSGSDENGSDNSSNGDNEEKKDVKKYKKYYYKREIYCGNCGEKGHVYKRCHKPITSFGIIAFRRQISDHLNKEKLSKEIREDLEGTFEGQEECDEGVPLRILFVQRKDTMGYVDFLRGRYPLYSEEEKEKKIKTYISEMIESEREKIRTLNFNELWDDLWINHGSKCYKNEFESAKDKFIKLDIKKLMEGVENKWKYTEFGLPKGRKNMREKNLDCAIREFCEETGYRKDNFVLLPEEPIEEVFVGTNGVKYKHVYYFAEVLAGSGTPEIDYSNKNQAGEIKRVIWLTKNQSMRLIRPYDEEKKKIVNDVFERFSGTLCTGINKHISNNQ